MLGIAEPVSTFCGADCSYLSGPVVNVLKEVMVEVFIVDRIKSSGRHGLICAGQEHELLELVEGVLIAYSCLVAQH